MINSWFIKLVFSCFQCVFSSFSAPFPFVSVPAPAWDADLVSGSRVQAHPGSNPCSASGAKSRHCGKGESPWYRQRNQKWNTRHGSTICKWFKLRKTTFICWFFMRPKSSCLPVSPLLGHPTFLLSKRSANLSRFPLDNLNMSALI